MGKELERARDGNGTEGERRERGWGKGEGKLAHLSKHRPQLVAQIMVIYNISE